MALRACFIGAGKMGGGMIHRLTEQGHTLTVWNRTAARAHDVRSAAKTPASIDVAEDGLVAALKRTDVRAPVFVIFGEMKNVFDVVNAADAEAEGVWAGRTVVNITSGNPDEGRAVAALLKAKGVAHYVDACFSGGPDKAAKGTGTLFISSDDAETTAALQKSHLNDMATVVFAGPIGASRALDYCVVDLALAAFVSYSSNLSMLEKEGVAPEIVQQCVAQRVATIPAVLEVFRKRMEDRSDEAYKTNPIATLDTWHNFVTSRVPYYKEHGFSTSVPDYNASILLQAGATGPAGSSDMTRLQEVTRYSGEEQK
eukprot:Rhum_TRINITY_DN2115_c0_g1::Rhum_TRINITY_DN2115_c0_g1_i1::g.6010::m.6010/K00020/mmsB, HIBADH; 3-hydroxyisobutyrate dehydrogenase